MYTLLNLGLERIFKCLYEVTKAERIKYLIEATTLTSLIKLNRLKISKIIHSK